jgi:hypothetical protein
VRRFMVSGAVLAALVLSGCGGDDDAGTAAPSAAPSGAATTSSMPDGMPTDLPTGTPTGGGAPGGGSGTCVALAQTVTAALTKVAQAGMDYSKAASEFQAGASTVRSQLGSLPAAAKSAGEDVASGMEAAAKAAPGLASGNSQPYLDAQKKVGDALVKLGSNCGS